MIDTLGDVRRVNVGGAFGCLFVWVGVATLGGVPGGIGSVSMMFGKAPGVTYGRDMSAMVRMAVVRSKGWCAKGVEGIGFCRVHMRVLVVSTAISVGVGYGVSISCGKNSIVLVILS
jgi:hypothetical protein